MAKSFKKISEELNLIEDYKGSYISNNVFTPEITIRKTIFNNKKVWEIVIYNENYGLCNKKSEIPNALEYILKYHFDISL